MALSSKVLKLLQQDPVTLTNYWLTKIIINNIIHLTTTKDILCSCKRLLHVPQRLPLGAVKDSRLCGVAHLGA